MLLHTIGVWMGWTIISSIGSLLAAVVAGTYTYYNYHLLQNDQAEPWLLKEIPDHVQKRANHALASRTNLSFHKKCWRKPEGNLANQKNRTQLDLGSEVDIFAK